MTKKIEDYLHFYIGCEYWREWDGKTGILSYNNILTLVASKVGTIKPILRSLSDMTKEEAIGRAMARGYKREYIVNLKFKEFGFEFGNINTGTFLATSGPYVAYKSEELLYLLSYSFDLFGLIEAGLALDKTSL